MPFPSLSSFRFAIPRPLCERTTLPLTLLGATLISFSGMFAWSAQNPAPDEVRMSSHPFLPGGIAVKSTLVEVDTVVRDENGRTVSGLKAEDFKILDNGKPQAVSGFTVQTLRGANTGSPATAPNSQPISSPDAQPAPPTAAAALSANPARFVAFYFDDLHTDHGDMEHARDAAKGFMKRGFETGDHIGVFTSSGDQTLEFTDDTNKINETLAKVHPNLRMSPNGMQVCPQIPPYTAYVISNHLDEAALQLAVDQAVHCNCDTDSEVPSGTSDRQCASVQRLQVQNQADQTWELAKEQSQTALAVLNSVVNHLAGAPGFRMVLVASSGFITGTLEQERDRILNQAIHSGIVINSLDAKGLYAEGPGGSASDPDILDTHNASLNAHNTIQRGARLFEQTAAMALLAEGTGGRFFQNNNDLPRGFRDLASAPEVSYLLGFDPSSAKPDGKFHNLKVEVAGKGHFNIEARRGYFSLTTALVEQNKPEEKIRAEVMAQDTLLDVPMQVKFASGKSDAGATELHVIVHVDPSHLAFQHQRDRSVEQLNFVAALFDSSGNFVVGKEAEMDLAFKAPTLDHYSREGMNFQMTLAAPAGEYRLRAVVQETVEGKMAAITQTAAIR